MVFCTNSTRPTQPIAKVSYLAAQNGIVIHLSRNYVRSHIHRFITILLASSLHTHHNPRTRKENILKETLNISKWCTHSAKQLRHARAEYGGIVCPRAKVASRDRSSINKRSSSRSQRDYGRGNVRLPTHIDHMRSTSYFTSYEPFFNVLAVERLRCKTLRQGMCVYKCSV